MTKKLSLGLTGRMGSGKGEVVEILKGAGFHCISLSDIVREEVARLGKPVDRAGMQDIGNRLRCSEGAGVLALRVRERIAGSTSEKWVIDGIRNPAEIFQLKQLGAFFLLAIDADMETILQRLKNRQRDTDRVDESELRQRLAREWGQGEPAAGQQVGKCMRLADYTVDNNKSLADLQIEVLRVLKEIIDFFAEGEPT